MAQTANTIFRDFVTEGVPSSGAHQPRKAEIREWGTHLEQILAGAQAGGGVVFLSKAAMTLGYAANQMAWVIADPIAGSNGIYQKQGASGAGSWLRVGDLPYSFIKALNTGAGTANAIEAHADVPIPAADGGALINFNIVADNTASPVSISFNGGAPLEVKTSSGTDVATGGLRAGMVVAGFVQGATFRLLSDQVSASIVAAAEAAQSAAVAAQREAEAARDVAVEAASTAAAQGNIPIFPAAFSMAAVAVPAALTVILVNGYRTPDDGGRAFYKRVPAEPAHAAKFQSADGSWWEIIEPSVNPLMFGAIGDGVTDDTQALRNWAAFGGTLEGVPKKFRITGPVEFRKPFRMNANGMEIEHDTADINPAVNVIAVNGFMIDGLKISGRKELKPAVQSTAHGIKIDECRDFTVQNCQILNTHEHGISVYSINDAAPVVSFGGKILNNTLKGCGQKNTWRGYGIWIFGFCEKHIVRGNHVSDCIGGISADDSSSSGPVRVTREIIISDNHCHAYNDAIRFESSACGTITGNIAICERSDGLAEATNVCGMMVRSIQTSTEPVVNVTVTGNYIRGPKYGLLLKDAADVVVSSNVIEQIDKNNLAYDEMAAVYISKDNGRECRDITLANNTVRSEGEGIRIYAPSAVSGAIQRIRISNNTITYIKATAAPSGTRGIYVDHLFDGFIIGNTIRKFNTGISSTTDSSSGGVLYVEGNIVLDCVSYAISYNGAAMLTVTKHNVTRGSGGGSVVGIHYSASANISGSERSGNRSYDGASDGSNVTKLYPNFPS